MRTSFVQRHHFASVSAPGLGLASQQARQEGLRRARPRCLQRVLCVGSAAALAAWGSCDGGAGPGRVRLCKIAALCSLSPNHRDANDAFPAGVLSV